MTTEPTSGEFFHTPRFPAKVDPSVMLRTKILATKATDQRKASTTNLDEMMAGQRSSYLFFWGTQTRESFPSVW